MSACSSAVCTGPTELCGGGGAQNYMPRRAPTLRPPHLCHGQGAADAAQPASDGLPRCAVALRRVDEDVQVSRGLAAAEGLGEQHSCKPPPPPIIERAHLRRDDECHGGRAGAVQEGREGHVRRDERECARRRRGHDDGYGDRFR